MNIHILQTLKWMLGYEKFINELVTKKRYICFEDVGQFHNYSAITSRSLGQKKGDTRAFTIPCTMGYLGLLQHCVTSKEILT